MKRKTIIDSAKALKNLAELNMPGKTAIKVCKLMRKVQIIIDEHTDVKKTLLNKYGERSENGISYEFPMPGSAFEFQETIDDYLNEEIENFDVKMIPMEKFGDSLKNIKPNILFSLSWFIEIDDEDESEPESENETKTRKKTKKK